MDQIQYSPIGNHGITENKVESRCDNITIAKGFLSRTLVTQETHKEQLAPHTIRRDCAAKETDSGQRGRQWNGEILCQLHI